MNFWIIILIAYGLTNLAMAATQFKYFDRETIEGKIETIGSALVILVCGGYVMTITLLVKAAKTIVNVWKIYSLRKSNK